MKKLILTVTAILGLTAGTVVTAPTAHALPSEFVVTAANPSAEQLGQIIEFLVETNASDEAKARNLEGGMDAVVVPQTVYRLGLFRAPRGSNDITAVTSRSSSSVQATLQAKSSGRPTVNTTVEFKKISGNWRLSNNSICHGVKTVGLKIYCNA